MKKTQKQYYAEAHRLYHLPFFDLLNEAHQVHRQNHDPNDIQRCTLLSIKTGNCPEDCSYCPQSAHYETDVEARGLLPLDEVTAAAREARANGAQRFCMGAAWRNVKDGADFDRVLDMIRAVKNEGLEVCVTLGMLNRKQAEQLKEAGVYAYNHNLDTSRDYYKKIITTRTYDDRLDTLRAVREAGMTVCCGGIIGMGESVEDRCSLLAEVAALDPQPESVPINQLVPAKGTPLENAPSVDPVEFVRIVAVARILLPKTRVRLSAGRMALSPEAQLLAFFAGANSIFLGDKLLTTPNASPGEDAEMLREIAGCNHINDGC